MSRRWLCLLRCLIVCLCVVPFVVVSSGTSAQPASTIRVSEAATRLTIADSSLKLSLPVENSAAKPTPARVRLELLDPQDRVVSRADVTAKLARGTTRVEGALGTTGFERYGSERRELVWYRVRYRVEPAPPADPSAFNAATGVVSVSEIARDLFELRVATSGRVREGQLLHAQVQATHPLTGRPVRGVRLEGEASFDDEHDETQRIKARGETGADGTAALDFQLPRAIPDDDVDLDVTGRLGEVVREESSSLDLDRRVRVLLSTDKPLYQPGQTVHLRALVVTNAERALANAEGTLKVEDPESQTVFDATLKTSRFGVASADWKLADNTRLVRETEREWNYAEQRYDTKEAEKYEGELDEAGGFKARVDLTKAHEELADSSWRRFDDLTFAAYVTDPTTNRTEQRRFRLRVTKEPVHIYVAQANREQSRTLPLEFFVATSYADGSPAECEVRIEEKLSDESTHTGAAARGGAHKPLAKVVKTNRLGVAKVTMAAPTGHDAESREIALHFAARDRAGKTGSHDDELWLADRPVVRVETDKSIYREGEAIQAEIISDKSDLKVVVEAVAGERSLSAQTVRLVGGRAVVTIPYRAEFQNRVTVVAYTAALGGEDDDEIAKGTRTVIYPHNRELSLDVNFSSATYKPGEEASARVSARTAQGRAAETALGVVVFDKAVEERARTEQEFSSSYGFYDGFRYFWYGDDTLGGLTLRDLERLDPAKTITPELDSAAELLLQRESYYEPKIFGGDGYTTDQSAVFASLAASELKAARDVISSRYEKAGEYPRDEATLRRIIAEGGVAPQSLLDPWGTPYRGVFYVEESFDVVKFESAGADKKFGTPDDWRAGKLEFAYFRPQGETLSRLVADYHRRTGDFLRDAQTLKQELLARAGLDFDALRDRWGKPYDLRFAVNGSGYTFTVWSAGADGVWAPAGSYGGDDFSLWSTWTDYFAEPRATMDTALEEFHRATGGFPKDEKTLAEALRRVSLDLASLRDPWTRPYYATFSTESRYADRTQTVQQSAGSTPHTQITPVTQKLDRVSVRSAGADGRVGTSDDFSVADFSAVESEQSARDREPQPAPKTTTFVNGTGAISGTVTDPAGATVPNATVTAKHQYLPDATFTATTDESGVYLLRNLPSGLYTLTVDAQGFKRTVIMEVAVHSESLARVDVRVEVSGVTECVTVTAGAQETMNATCASVSTTKERGHVIFGQKAPVSTPRLRKEFPETLYWQPELITDARGRSEIRFKLADNITTWKMSVIGSNEKGEIGTVEKEFRAFQPFFVELDPPPVLTEGDEIALPVVVRNYLDTRQRVSLDLKPESWFALLTPATRETQVAAGDAARETFDVRAVSSVKDGKQQVTARGADAADAVEKTVSVHPDGEEIAETATQLVGETGALEVNVPASVIRGSLRAELKVYPNLLAHVVEGVEAIMRRPYGCGEQTISSTYPSLLVLRHYKQLGVPDSQLPHAAAKAREYLQQGYERLLTYRAADGGFTYWGRGDSDTALTAYALRFLVDARDLVAVDDDLIAGARAWLARQQREDGSWVAHHWSNAADPRGDATLTAYVARTLARIERQQHDKHDATNTDGATNVNDTANTNGAANANVKTSPSQTASNSPTAAASVSQTPSNRTPLERALDYLARRAGEFDEPYLLAAYALALTDSGAPPEKVEPVIKRLRSLARDEHDGTYWALETNTPFYGWGLAGRVETTALAVTALARSRGLGIGGQGS
ncbi:MAG: carboxypeptidase regulatory-like domain-containing protein, partial [Acidobacteria bacterium]|nr:carboxypeptidase regulatory-like domain-containing protein [Acidobacteriota bacterium]